MHEQKTNKKWQERQTNSRYHGDAGAAIGPFPSTQEHCFYMRSFCSIQRLGWRRSTSSTKKVNRKFIHFFSWLLVWLFVYAVCSFLFCFWKICSVETSCLPVSIPWGTSHRTTALDTINAIPAASYETTKTATTKTCQQVYEHSNCKRVGAIMFRFPLTLQTYIIFIANVHWALLFFSCFVSSTQQILFAAFFT